MTINVATNTNLQKDIFLKNVALFYCLDRQTDRQTDRYSFIKCRNKKVSIKNFAVAKKPVLYFFPKYNTGFYLESL